MIKEGARSLLQDTQEYEDTGCEAADKCIECPLPQCRYDDDSWFYRYKILLWSTSFIFTLTSNLKRQTIKLFKIH